MEEEHDRGDDKGDATKEMRDGEMRDEKREFEEEGEREKICNDDGLQQPPASHGVSISLTRYAVPQPRSAWIQCSGSERLCWA